MGRDGNKKSSSDFSIAEYPTRLEFPPLIYLLKKENLSVEIGRVTSITRVLLPPFGNNSLLLPDTVKSPGNGSRSLLHQAPAPTATVSVSG